MKRIAIVTIILLFLLPLVSATVEITGLDADSYNYGDNIDVSGYVLVDEEFTGYFQLEINCNSLTQPYQLIPLDLNSGEQVQFYSLNLPNIIISSFMAGNCSVTAKLLNNGAVIESASSESFSIVPTLEGVFSLTDSRIQVGKSVDLAGTITQLDGDKIDGVAEIYFSNDGSRYLVDIVPVINGILEFSYQFNHGQPGDYSIDITIRDDFGNRQEFGDVASFELIDELYVFAKTDLKQYEAGATANVFGDIRTILQDKVDDVDVTIKLKDEEYDSTVDDSSFNYFLQLPTDIETGEHMIIVTAEDSFGNEGQTEINIVIKAKPTAITSGITTETIIPGTEIEFKPLLYDQAGDLISDTIFLEIFNPEGLKVYSQYVPVDQITTYTIASDAIPGNWIIQTSKDSLSNQEIVVIEELENLDIEINNQTLIITNTGNVQFKDYLELVLDGTSSDYNIKKKINLGVDEVAEFDLAQEVPTGRYSISIPGFDEGYDVSVVGGKSRLPLNYIYTALVLMFVSFLVYMMYTRIRPLRPKDKAPTNDFSKPMVKKEKKPVAKKPWQKNESDIADFKQRVLKEIRKTEQKENRETAAKKFYDSGYGREVKKNVLDKADNNKEGDSNNPFSMFD